MSTILEQSPARALSCVEGSPYLFSTEDFYRMVDLYILPMGNRAYLWDGLVYEKPINTMLRSAFVLDGLRLNALSQLPPAARDGSTRSE